MAKPIPSDPEAILRDLGDKVRAAGRHRHPEYVRRSATPQVIAGSRSADTVAILTELLAALDAAGIIDDTTTG
ncbi:MAG: hypothetical protein E6R04_05225 [Spirochaetes bacterium]|nr:MAG: hypothetical protein E6R04_05225 [Spirochaetota bacterium]